MDFLLKLEPTSPYAPYTLWENLYTLSFLYTLWYNADVAPLVVGQIPPRQTHDWLRRKHYARRVPHVMYAFGLYTPDWLLNGVITFGLPANYIEVQAWEPYPLLELNRLVVEDGLPKNSLSFFVGAALKLLPKPTVIISYSDLNMGHHGYIYQACNFIYTGMGGEKNYRLPDGSTIPRRHHERFGDSVVVEGNLKKARYYYFLGSKVDKAKMRRLLRYPVLPYPKGDNQRYDANYHPAKQGLLIKEGL